MARAAVITGAAVATGIALIFLSRKSEAATTGETACAPGSERGAIFDRKVADALRHVRADLSSDALKVMVGHAREETGQGEKAFGNNFWNVNWYGVGPYCIRNDRFQGKDHFRKFVVYNSPLAAATYYLHELNYRYPLALAAALRGDAAGYARGLKQGRDGYKWYEGPENDMVSALTLQAASAAV